MPFTRRALFGHLLRLAPAAAVAVAAPQLLVPAPKKLYRGYSDDELWRPPHIHTLAPAGAADTTLDLPAPSLTWEAFVQGDVDRTLIMDGVYTGRAGDTGVRALAQHLCDRREISLVYAFGGKTTLARGYVESMDQQLRAGQHGSFSARVVLTADDGPMPRETVVLPPENLRQLRLEQHRAVIFRSMDGTMRPFTV